MDLAIAESQRIDGPGRTGTLGQVLPRQLMRFELERQGHVQSVAAAGDKIAHAGGKAVQRRQQAFIGQRHSLQAGELEVDVRRLAVRNRVADNGVALGHDGHYRKGKFGIRPRGRLSPAAMAGR